MLYTYVTQQDIYHIKMAGVGFCAICLFRNNCLFEHCYWSILSIENIQLQIWLCWNLSTNLVAAFVFPSQKGEHILQPSWIRQTNRVLQRSINTCSVICSLQRCISFVEHRTSYYFFQITAKIIDTTFLFVKAKLPVFISWLKSII